MIVAIFFKLDNNSSEADMETIKNMILQHLDGLTLARFEFYIKNRLKMFPLFFLELKEKLVCQKYLLLSLTMRTSL